MNSELIQEISDLKHQIQSYDCGKIIINQQAYTTPVYFSEDTEVKHWPIPNLQSLTLAALQSICFDSDHILIIGTGQEHQTIDLQLIAKSNLSIEYMRTQAACHTYTLLAQEKRPVIAALIL